MAARLVNPRTQSPQLNIKLSNLVASTQERIRAITILFATRINPPVVQGLARQGDKVKLARRSAPRLSRLGQVIDNECPLQQRLCQRHKTILHAQHRQCRLPRNGVAIRREMSISGGNQIQRGNARAAFLAFSEAIQNIPCRLGLFG